MKKFEELDDNMLESVVGGISAEDKPRRDAILRFMSDYKRKCRDYALAGDRVPLITFGRSEGKGKNWYGLIAERAGAGDFYAALNIIDVIYAPGLRELSATYPDFAELLTRLDNLHNG